jgi:3-deoxy-D-arabino-heptulosonate 7-phosphate (DAHP) synthase class II
MIIETHEFKIGDKTFNVKLCHQLSVDGESNIYSVHLGPSRSNSEVVEYRSCLFEAQSVLLNYTRVCTQLEYLFDV